MKNYVKIAVVALLVSASPFFWISSCRADLSLPGWNSDVRQKLQKLIDARAGTGDPVVFDFDNTLVSRDIGEATFAQLVTDKKLTSTSLPAAITPSFMLNGEERTLERIDDQRYDLTSYYEDFLSASKHHSAETTPYANGYAWVVQIMAGMSPFDVVEATQRAYSQGVAESDHLQNRQTKIQTPASSYRRPFFYPEMVELVGEFLKNDYQVYVISASNVWTVRYMVTQVLNKKLRAAGAQKGIEPQNVLGVATLIRSRENGKLFKDPLLVRENADYAALDSDTLKKYTLTTQVVYPLTGYFGKVANILKSIGRAPYFTAGDSPNDHPMLSFSKNQLWLARLEKEGYQAKTVSQVQKHQQDGTWLVQPVLYKASAGFVPNRQNLTTRLPNLPDSVKSSIRLLTEASLLRSF